MWICEDRAMTVKIWLLGRRDGVAGTWGLAECHSATQQAASPRYQRTGNAGVTKVAMGFPNLPQMVFHCEEMRFRAKRVPLISISCLPENQPGRPMFWRTQALISRKSTTVADLTRGRTGRVHKICNVKLLAWDSGNFGVFQVDWPREGHFFLAKRRCEGQKARFYFRFYRS
jgi:hypothetical protein